MKRERIFIISAMTLLLAQSITTQASEKQDIKSNPLREAYFGETHMHTAYSLDA